MSDPAFDAYMALMAAELTAERVTDPDEVEELRRQFAYLPKRRRWPVVRVAPAPALRSAR